MLNTLVLIYLVSSLISFTLFFVSFSAYLKHTYCNTITQSEIQTCLVTSLVPVLNTAVSILIVFIVLITFLQSVWYKVKKLF